MDDRRQSAHQPAMPQVRIEPARWGDIAAVIEIQRASFRPGLAYGRFALTSLKLMPGIQFLVARTADHNVAGCIIGDMTRGNARVMNIAVHPASRRQGIGTLLLHAIETALPNGDVVLMAEEHNQGAQTLYKREGYVRTGQALHYYGRGRHGVWMRKSRGPGAPPTVRVP